MLFTEMKTGIIIQARMGASRLPNKMILPLESKKGVLELILKRITNRFSIPVILATTKNSKDDLLCQIAKKYKVRIYRGSEENVLSRFIEAAELFDVNNIVRVCADNPFLDVSSIHDIIEMFNDENGDYFSFQTEDKVPAIRTHFGLWVEGVKLTALKKVLSITQEKLYLEHVTNFIYENDGLFKVVFKNLKDVKSTDGIRLTMDTIDDYNIIREIMSKIEMGNLDSREFIRKIKKNSEWIDKMNNSINQNLK